MNKLSIAAVVALLVVAFASTSKLAYTEYKSAVVVIDAESKCISSLISQKVERRDIILDGEGGCHEAK